MSTKISTLLIALLFVLTGTNIKATTVTVGKITGTYLSINAAINAVKPISEPLIIELTSDYVQTADTISAITGSSSINTVTIRPQTGVASLTVSGSSGAVWRMDGCSYVTIDGRAGGTGSTVLTLRADTLTGTSTTTALKKSMALLVTNSSTNDSVKFVNLRGATNESFWNGQPTTAPTMGVITLGAGSTNIVVDHCDVGPLHAYTGTPTASIVSLGTLALPNSGIVISNNNIYDYFARDLNKCTTIAGSGVGVLIYDYNSNCKVSGNSFYQTMQRTVFANNNNAKSAAIAIQNASGNGFIVKDNYIGGSQPQCGGSQYYLSIGNATGFNGIYMAASTTGTSAIYNNTIKNLYLYAHSPIAQVYQSAAISISGGNVLVGIKEDGTTAAGNIIGDQLATAVGTTGASIIFTGSNSNAAFSGILFNSLASANVKIANNKIAGICINSYATSRTCSFVGVNIIGTAASTALIDNNEIGNNATGVVPASMSIQNYQGRGCFGIYMNSAGAAASVLTISNNKINNMYKSIETPTAGTNQTYVNGIWINTAVLCPVTISNNEIRDLVFTSSRVNDTPINWASGITFGSQAVGSVINNNTIYNIEGLNGASTSVMGICLLPTVNAATITVNSNLIYNLSSNVTRKLSQYATGLTGIFTNTTTAISPTLNVYNNMIRLGYNRAGSELSSISTIVGIRDSILTTAAAKANYYHNTIYIGGSNVATSDTVPTFGMCFATSATNAVVRNVSNNLIVNARSNATTGSGHYAIATGSASALTAFTSNNNDYVSSGTGGVLGRFVSKTDAPTLSAIQTATGGDVMSVNLSPVFVNETGTTPDLHLNSTNYTNSALNFGVYIATVITDFDGNSRAGSPTIGADEFTGPGTLVQDAENLNLNVYHSADKVYVKGVGIGDIITVYSVGGQMVKLVIANDGVTSFTLTNGVYIIRIKSKTSKIII